MQAIIIVPLLSSLHLVCSFSFLLLRLQAMFICANFYETQHTLNVHVSLLALAVN